MLRGWFGMSREGREAGEKPPLVEGEPGGDAGERSEEQGELQADPQSDSDSDPLLHQAKGLGSYLFSFATTATKKISESVAETAQTIKKSVEEGKIENIIDKTIIGDFQKEQKKFVQQQHTKKSGQGHEWFGYILLAQHYKRPPFSLAEAAVPPWVDSNEEEIIQQQILALSADRRNFLRDPPAGVQFNFDFDQMYPVALVMLQEDQLLNRMRFDLVPKHLSFPSPETVRPKTPPVAIKSQLKPQEEDEEISTSPGVSEFVSDAFDACSLNQEDLRKEIEQLVLDKKKDTTTEEEETADWEKELQQELQEYEVVTESEKRDENWDKEIEEMLQGEN
ncbi:hypothetical protein JD844_032443 [Phrynosoma platyrhinos]|uniref:Synapse associated protein 1 n=1 Tax=Phrynosoma platyrhinos TaxID=52577 RepID=A0ABQ7T625_PHRPL|nr:hypothetical protein JD844_032443 [Phrynosoma platyrhinos]